MLKKILNLHENATSLRLGKVCEDYEAQAFPKIRVADVLPIESSGITDTEYSYALKAHFDFVICDKDHAPQFVVEYDGPSHGSDVQKARDEMKNRLCDRFDLPLLRINSNHLSKKYREYDLLTWLVEAWFMEKEFRRAQDNGQVPWEEDFDPMLVFSMPGKSAKFPMWLSAELRVKVQKLFEKGTIAGRIISHWIGVDDADNYHGISWIKISDQIGVMAETSMRRQQFPVPGAELLSEILCFQAYDQLDHYLQGKTSGIQYPVIMDRLRQCTNKFQARSIAGSGDETPPSL